MASKNLDQELQESLEWLYRTKIDLKALKTRSNAGLRCKGKTTNKCNLIMNYCNKRFICDQ